MSKPKTNHYYLLEKYFNLRLVMYCRTSNMMDRSEDQIRYLQYYYMLNSLVNNSKAKCRYKFNEDKVKALYLRLKQQYENAK